MSENKELEEETFEGGGIGEDLSSFVDVADLGDLENISDQEMFGDLGDLGDLGDMPEILGQESATEPEKEAPQPEITEKGQEEPAFHSVEPQEGPSVFDQEEEISGAGTDRPSTDSAFGQNATVQDAAQAEGVSGQDAVQEREEQALGTAVEEEAPSTDAVQAEETSGQDTAQNGKADGLDNILQEDLGSITLDDRLEGILNAGSEASKEPSSQILKEAGADDGQIEDIQTALDLVPDEEEENSGVASMLDGLLDNLDMTGSVVEQDSDEDDEGMGMDDIPGLASVLSGGMEPEEKEMLEADAAEPDGTEPDGDGKQPGFFKKVFGNVVTDEIAEQERMAAQKEQEEAEKKAEEEQKAKEEKAAKKAEKAEAKAAKKEEKKKQKEAKKAEKAAKKAEKKAKREEEEAAELEVVGKLNKVGVSIIAAATVIFLAVEIAGTNVFGYVSTKNQAMDYFEMGKYTEAYQEAIGSKMKEKDAEEYNKIKVVMKVQQALNSYQSYDRISYYPEALDALLKGLQRYDMNIDQAVALDVDKDMISCRKQILSLLQQEFSLSESDAYSLLALDQKKYQDKVIAIGVKKKN